MALNKYRLGDIVIPYSKKCGIPNLTPYQVSGVNREKEFFEPSHQVGEDTSKYQIVPQSYFACNLMHVGRDRVLPIAYNHSGSVKYVSPAYTIFSLKEDCGVLDYYFFMMLKSEEQDRYFWFHADASVRDGLPWSAFCDIEIVVPDLLTQQKYVDIYKAMVANQQSYERGLEDLKLVLDASLEKYKRNTKRVVLSKITNEIDARNFNMEVSEVDGVNKDKQFMPAVASGEDLSKYKIVRKNQLACNLMHVGRDLVVPIALHTNEDPIIVSPAYVVFQINTESVLPQYVLMWFSRTETDRNAWFMCDNNIRGGMEKKRFFEIEVPIPSIPEQSALVELFEVLSLRRSINEKMKLQINNICPILIRGSLEEGRNENI